MPRVTIDHREVTVPEGGTILDAARKLGLDIPALCFLDGHRPSTSCMVCQVKLKDRNRLVPSCATVVEDGMQVESETDEVRRVRRTALELLLSDHVGDCTAPCQSTCPTHMNIPLMLRQVAAGDLGNAIATIKSDMALPAVLGRVCPEVCERTCRRREVDSPVAICLVKRHVADVDLACETPYLPPCKPSSGKTVAIVGAGPVGLSAAYHLLQMGHACTLFDDQTKPGGRLRYEFDDERLPPHVLDAEITVIERLGARFRMDTVIGRDRALADLKKEHDVVLVAVGRLTKGNAARIGLKASNDRLEVDAKTHRTSMEGVYATGDAVSPSSLIVRSVAHGKAAAICINQRLSGNAVTGTPTSFTCRTGHFDSEEIRQLASAAGQTNRVAPPKNTTGGLTLEQAGTEALRCLHCDCGKGEGCKLRRYAQAYGASPNRYRGTRRPFERHVHPHPAGFDIVYEPGKCILCSLCVQIAAEADEPLGLTFVGRGFDVRVDVPFDRSIAEGLQHTARRCADACPTGALSVRTKSECNPSG